VFDIAWMVFQAFWIAVEVFLIILVAAICLALVVLGVGIIISVMNHGPLFPGVGIGAFFVLLGWVFAYMAFAN